MSIRYLSCAVALLGTIVPAHAVHILCEPGHEKPVCFDDWDNEPAYEPLPQMQDPPHTVITTIPMTPLPQSESDIPSEYARTPTMYDAPNWLMRP
jgi:hypothetical protein